MLGLVVFGLYLATQLTFVKLHISKDPPRTIAIHLELPVPPSIWEASAVLLAVLSLAVLLLAAFCHGSSGPLTTVPRDQDRTERDLELGNFAGTPDISLEEGENTSTPSPEIVDAEASPLVGGFPSPSYLKPPGAPGTASWTPLREKSRRVINWDWSEAFDNAYLGTVQETERIASGFGGTVCHGSLEDHPDLRIVSKEMHRDSEDEELFKEVAVGLLIPSSPYLGFATTTSRKPRLISACLPFTARGYWEQGLAFNQQRDLATGMVLAILHLHYLSLVHCDIKPDNFLVDTEGSVFVIDFGSVSREGDVPPMTCNAYRPPDGTVSRAWDIFSLGKVFYELFGATDTLPCKLIQFVDGMTCDAIEDRPSLQDCLDKLRCI